jgi:hypothetical protein
MWSTNITPSTLKRINILQDQLYNDYTHVVYEHHSLNS